MASAAKMSIGSMKIRKRIRRPGRHCKRLKKCHRQISMFGGK